MRHRLAGRKLNRSTSSRLALKKNLINSLFRHGRIRTTLPKAKEYRPRAEKLITLGRVDTVANRRRAFSILRDKLVVKKLFEEIGPRFKNRPGGYTRILHLSKRRVGDDASMALFELLPD
jgi:large subunit ribosomal protein L17